MGLFSKVIGTHSEREVKRVIPIVDKIESLEPEMEKLSDEELRGKTAEFKKRLADKETLARRKRCSYRNSKRLSGKA